MTLFLDYENDSTAIVRKAHLPCAGRVSRKTARVNPTGPPANPFTIAKKGKRT